MVTMSMEEEILLLEYESVYGEYMPYFEFEDVEVIESKPLPFEPVHWAYRVPSPGVKYYTFE